MSLVATGKLDPEKWLEGFRLPLKGRPIVDRPGRTLPGAVQPGPDLRGAPTPPPAAQDLKPAGRLTFTYRGKDVQAVCPNCGSQEVFRVKSPEAVKAICMDCGKIGPVADYRTVTRETAAEDRRRASQPHPAPPKPDSRPSPIVPLGDRIAELLGEEAGC